MNPVETFLCREAFFDAAIMKHGFTDYMRDYEIIVGGRDGPLTQTSTGISSSDASRHTV